MLYHFLSAKSDHSVFFLLLCTNLAWKIIYFLWILCLWPSFLFPGLCILRRWSLGYNINNVSLLIPYGRTPPPLHRVHLSYAYWVLPWVSRLAWVLLLLFPVAPFVCPGWIDLNEGSGAFLQWRSLPLTGEKSCQLLSPLTIICSSLEVGKWQLLKGLWNNCS